MNKFKIASILLIFCVFTLTVAFADLVAPRADLYFDSATAFLAADRMDLLSGSCLFWCELAGMLW